jgi:hypothetical protein
MCLASGKDVLISISILLMGPKGSFKKNVLLRVGKLVT